MIAVRRSAVKAFGKDLPVQVGIFIPGVVVSQYSTISYRIPEVLNQTGVVSLGNHLLSQKGSTLQEDKHATQFSTSTSLTASVFNFPADIECWPRPATVHVMPAPHPRSLRPTVWYQDEPVKLSKYKVALTGYLGMEAAIGCWEKIKSLIEENNSQGANCMFGRVSLLSYTITNLLLTISKCSRSRCHKLSISASRRRVLKLSRRLSRSLE